MSIRVIPVGTKIRTVIGKIEALITGVCIRDQYISYNIGYFIDGKYETAWLYRYEFNVDAAVPKKPGLVNYDNCTYCGQRFHYTDAVEAPAAPEPTT